LLELPGRWIKAQVVDDANLVARNISYDGALLDLGPERAGRCLCFSGAPRWVRFMPAIRR